ncbi:MAG: hypothetical protein ACFE0I_02960 [Elainellaceae cyanobacterium]
MIRIPLDLPDAQVLEVCQTEQGEWLIRVESRVNGTHCHRCSQDPQLLNRPG